MLILIRGLPGAGKTFLASALVGHINAANVEAGYPGSIIHLEADMFFEQEDGTYSFNRIRLPEAHRWCQDAARKYCAENTTVIVANTFTTIGEIRPYMDMSRHPMPKHIAELLHRIFNRLWDENRFPSWINEEAGIAMITVSGSFESIHDVPNHIIERMRARFVPQYEVIQEILDNE